MNPLRRILRAFRLTRFRPDPARDVRDEIELYLELRAREFMAEGMDEEEARAAAREAFGDVERIEEKVRKMTERRELKRSWKERAATWLGDVSFALRGLARNPGFAAVAVFTLALGIGANTAIFSLVDAALLRSPPVERPDELVMVYTTCRSGEPRCSSSWPDYEDYRDQASSLVDLAAYAWVPLSVGGEDAQATLATGQPVNGSYFELLGVRPEIGRLIQPADGEPGADPAVAVLEHDFWRDRFGGDPDAVGRRILLNGSRFTVVGVAPEGFRGIDLQGEPDVWLPMRAGPLLGESAGSVAQDEILAQRGHRWIPALVGRRAPETSIAGVREELRTVAARLNGAYPDARGERTVTVDPADRYALPAFGGDALVRFVGLLAGVVGVVLLLACANLANLLLARAAGRAKELGIRRALGAGRARLVRQLLVESGVLAGIGGAVGLGVARALMALLRGFELPGFVAVASLDPGLDGRILAFTGLLCLVTALLFGLVPALRATGGTVIPALRSQASDRAPGTHRLRKGLVALQVALCVVLLAGSGLFVRTLQRALAFDPGFEAEGLALVRYNPGFLRYGPGEAQDLVRRVEERAGALPGVRTATHSSLVPLQGGGHIGFGLEVEGYQPAPDEEMGGELVVTRPGLFRALGIPISSGRAIEPSDRAGTGRVMVVSESMARRWWPGGEAVGGRVRVGGGEPFTVVGVAADARWRGLEREPGPRVFLSADQFPSMAFDDFITLVVDSDRDASGLLSELRSVFRELEPRLALTSVQTMEDNLDRVLASQRMGALLLSAFGGLALLLAVVGIYGVVSYTVRQGRREIGIRMALGADGRRVVTDVLKGVTGPVLLGAGAGVGAAVLLAPAAESFLFRTSPTDPATFAGVTGMLLVVAAAAAFFPARRATRVDPVEVLGAE